MNAIDTARLVLYRVHEKGLEVFLVRDEQDDLWKLPQGAIKALVSKDGSRLIELDPVRIGDDHIKTLAIEADWHEIPSIRELIKHDLHVVKHKIKNRIPGLDQGAFFAIKEGIKTALPEEYQALKELKDILSDRNLVLNI